jgi:hypothetical protein
MTLYHGADASEPEIALPNGYRIVAGYIGALDLPGPPDTPHIWTVQEWNRFLDQAGNVRALPIYTHDYPGNPSQDAQNADDAATDLGWDPDNGSRIMAWDSEFLSDNTYCAGLKRALNVRGWRLMTYERTPLQDPATDLRWIFNIQAPFTKPPSKLPAGADGLQWSFAGKWDLDIFSQTVFDGCGIGPRHVNS